MKRLATLAAAVLLLTAPPDAAPLAAEGHLLASEPRRSDLFPRPAELERDIAFWKRIYTEVGTDGGLIHDSRNLAVVYQVVGFPEGSSSRTRERLVDKARSRYREILRRLAGGKRSGLEHEHARVLHLFPKDVSNSELRAASSRIRFQLGQADKFRGGLVRSGAWRSYIRQTFRDMGLPEELAALPHVESSFTPWAYSRVGAAGLWQFTRSTGRRYMRVDHVVDERLDPFHATVAAARLLEHNYKITGTWPLALTAYNHGASGMRRASRKLGTKDIATIARNYKSRTFGFASRNFYVEFLAALDVDSDPERYFGPLTLDAPIHYEAAELPFYAGASALPEALGVDLETLKSSNRALGSSVWNGSKRVPKGFVLRAPRTLLAEPLGDLLATLPESARYARQTRDTYHKVRRGENLSAIASRYRVSMSELVHLNGLRSRHRIRAGQLLRLPDEAGASRQARRPPPPEPEAAPESGLHTVRRGDTIADVARRYGVAESELVQWNGIRNRHRIHVGQRLRVTPAAPVPAASATAAPAPHPDRIAEFTEPPSGQPEFGPAQGTGEPVTEAEEELAIESVLVADPSDYSVSSDGSIEAQAAETLGHYAEWLDVRASRLRQINRISYGTPIEVGERVVLDLSRVTPETFESRRLEHHQALQSEFFDRFEIRGTTTHVTRRGESIWLLAQRKYEVPVWLLRQYNPDVDFANLHAGMELEIPKLKHR